MRRKKVTDCVYERVFIVRKRLFGSDMNYEHLFELNELLTFENGVFSKSIDSAVQCFS